MAEIADLEEALRNAAAAGDTASANKLADAIYQAKVNRPIANVGGNRGARGISAAQNAKDIFGEVQRGGVDVLGGGAQLLARGANAVGLVPESNPGGLLAGPADVEAQNVQARANIDSYTTPSNGMSPIRMGAGALLSMPFTPVRAMQAPTILGRSMGTGASGAIAGGLQEVQNPQSNTDFWKTKAAQVGIGGVVGALSQPIAEAAVKAVASGINSLSDRAVAGARSLTGANSMDKIVTLTREALKKSGIDYDSLTDTVKQGLFDDVQKAMGSYSGINPGAIGRQAAFRQEGFDPLRHWISKDPSEFTQIENLAHTPQGAPLKDRANALDQFVMQRINGMRGNPVDPLAAGDLVSKDLKSYLGQQQGKTNVLYDTFGAIAPAVRGDPQRFVNDAFGGLEGKMALGSLPSGITNIVNGISKGEIPLTPSTLYQLQKMLKPGADGSQNYALGHLSRAIDREMSAISESLPGNASRDASTMPVPQGYKGPSATDANNQGQYAADVLKMARGQHAQTQGEIENSRILTGAENGKPSDTVASSFMASDLRDVAKNWTRLSDESKDAMRSRVMDDIRSKVFGGATDESGKAAAQASLSNALSDPTYVSKLRIVLGDEGVQGVKRLALMLESAKIQPAGSAVNNSKTGGAITGNLLSLADIMKGKGIIGGTAAQDTMRNSATQAAMASTPDVLGRRSLVIDPLMQEILARRVGQGAGLLGGSAGYAGLLSAYQP